MYANVFVEGHGFSRAAQGAYDAALTAEATQF